MKSFSGKCFAAIRRASGYTQKTIGESVGTSERMVRKWEGGDAEPTASFLLRLMVLLNCSAQDLLIDPDANQ